MSKNYSTIAYGLLKKVGNYNETRKAYGEIENEDVRVICEDQIMEQYAEIYGAVKSFSREERDGIIDAASHVVDSLNKDIRDYAMAYLNLSGLKDFVSVVNSDEQSAIMLDDNDSMSFGE